ncbi:hypothetical protein [Dyella sp. Tek66A03]|uniref:hypothetical protein n=1 Tax=Dyella sp. Tek66A03 TaxID=3458298 RepID=UPI00403E376D
MKTMLPTDDWQTVINDAWNSIRAKVALELPPAVMKKALTDQSYTDSLGVCSTLNSPYNRGSAIWGDDGKGTIRLTSLQVSDFTSVTALPAVFNNFDVRLPLPFSLLQASGRYGYEQTCALYSLGKKGNETKVKGAGSMSSKSEGGTLIYQIKVVDPDKALRLQLTGATVDGKRSVVVKSDSEPDNAVLRWLVDVFGRGLQEKMRISAALDSFFAHGQFGLDMVAELNRIIGVTLAAREQR